MRTRSKTVAVCVSRYPLSRVSPYHAWGSVRRDDVGLVQKCVWCHVKRHDNKIPKRDREAFERRQRQTSSKV